jgi:hypothetical protein
MFAVSSAILLCHTLKHFTIALSQSFHLVRGHITPLRLGPDRNPHVVPFGSSKTRLASGLELATAATHILRGACLFLQTAAA